MPARKTAVSAADFVPDAARLTLPVLRDAAASCRGCDLYKNATQTVFGEIDAGTAKPAPSRRAHAATMLVGEQPGDEEDKAGRPFVGPAGRMLDELLERAGIDRSQAYVTNAVKHFRWEPRGTRRLHAKPSARHINACKPWLIEEVRVVTPRVVVCLGATAARAVLGPDVRVSRSEGETFHADDLPGDPAVVATIHPSAALRAPTGEKREAMRERLVRDLTLAARLAGLTG